MSDMWAPDMLDAVERVPVWTRPVDRRFVERPAERAAGFTAWAEPVAPSAAGGSDGADPLDAIRNEAYAMGFDAGHATAEATLAPQRAQLTRLAEALETLHPEPSADLARLLAESVSRLVRQVVGEVTLDGELIAERTRAVAALLVDETGPSRLRLNPADLALLDGAAIDLPMIADATLAEGTILAETASGWIEDGPAIRMERLRALLDTLATRR